MLSADFETFCDRPSVRGLKQVLESSCAQPIWWNIPGGRPRSLDYSFAKTVCPFVERSLADRRTCERRFLRALSKAHKTQGPVTYLCPIKRHTLCLPVVMKEKTQGYVAICNRPERYLEDQAQLAGLVVGAAAKELERQEELKNVSDSIQPRCVALSTVHTIHRLISSTLNLEELLPRVARLCCQVLRAQFCTIWLADREKHLLVPRAVVSTLSGKKGAASPTRIGKGLVGRIAAACQSQMTDQMMAVPLVEEECLGVLQVRRLPKKQPFGALDQEILTTLAEQAVVAIRNAQMYGTQERVTWGTIRSLSAILDSMESHSLSGRTHHKFLARVAIAIARTLKLSEAEQRSLEYAAYLHDAGRVGIPEEILRKPSKLEPAEIATVQKHLVAGTRILEPLEILEPAIPIILHHHERYDGTGYPKGLRKEAIPMGARILAVANAFEAMVFDRPYRRAMSIAQAAREITSHAGTQFDPKVVRAFQEVVRTERLETLLKES